MMKNTFSLRLLFLTVMLVSANTISFAQSQKSISKNYSKYPYWVEMMEDSSVNYFEAIKAYDEFWAKRKKPIQEDEMISEKSAEEARKKSFWNKLFPSREEKEEAESAKFKFLCKKFEHWKFTMQPYVQADGRILTTTEQLELWKTQRPSK